MADEEQFSLCWNNFNSNLSAGFHESLCRGDLVDVTLAAEGHLVKAHRLVLSVCSPYFRKMFTQMPANQHAFVFLKDVSHAALKDLIQFMYCGEVNVKQDALPTFISTAEALQIKGLTETGDASSTSAPAQSPVKIPTPAPSTTSTTAASPRTRSSGIQRNISRTSYKMDSEDSCDDKSITPAQTIVSATVATTGVAQKRIVQRSLTPVSASQSVKRLKSSDPLEESEQHHHHHHVISASDTKSTAGDEPEFIDLPIETMPTKSEPDYDESGDVEAVEHDVSYVEDDSYGDMKYDESYFTENDDAKAGASGFSEGTYAESGSGDQPSNEAQETIESPPKRTTPPKSKRGRPAGSKRKSPKVTITSDVDKYLCGRSWPLVYVQAKYGGLKINFFDNHFVFYFNRMGAQFWRCMNYANGCPAIVISKNNQVYIKNIDHNHSINCTDKTTSIAPAAAAASSASRPSPSPSPSDTMTYVIEEEKIDDDPDNIIEEEQQQLEEDTGVEDRKFDELKTTKYYPTEMEKKLSIVNLREQMKMRLQKALLKK